LAAEHGDAERLVLRRAGAPTAAITVDFTGLVSVIWVRLDPQNRGAWAAA
jgi:hypothetical protein